MDEKRGDDTLSERLIQGRTEPEKEEPAGANEAWSEEYSERETMERPVGSSEAGVMTLAGRYKVVRRLGEGGMGSVWLAEDLKLDGRRVAIKMLPAVLAGKKTACRQVKQEALMAMKLSHPNIATVRAFEEEEGGNPFLVMDYIEGTGLDEILAEKGKLSEEETVKLLAPVAAALDYAHEKGVVHRDVKPGNVMVAKDGTPYVLDFGIAREVKETMTRVTGKFTSGTLLYMSPEQLRGRAPKVAQDVYSFSAMAYECLTGMPPFSRGQIEYQIVHEAPEPLSEDAAGGALRQGVMAGLAKESEYRPGTCMGVLGSGGASRPGEPEKGRTAGTAAGRPTGSAVGDAAGRTARPEASPQQGGGARSLPNADAASAERAGSVRTIALPGGVEMELVWCPPGRFTMGSPAGEGFFQKGKESGRWDDERQHEVILTEGFWMAKTEVTQKQWKSVMDDNPSYHKGDALPVENVSWDDCVEFCRRVGLALPTEAQWEYACRAGTEGAYAEAGGLDALGWYAGNSGGKTHPVGRKRPNAWGLHDMHGNVWEWCADWYGDYPEGVVTNPTGVASGKNRVLRGGSFWSSPRNCRSANRIIDPLGSRDKHNGFRPVARGE